MRMYGEGCVQEMYKENKHCVMDRWGIVDIAG